MRPEFSSSFLNKNYPEPNVAQLLSSDQVVTAFHITLPPGCHQDDGPADLQPGLQDELDHRRARRPQDLGPRSQRKAAAVGPVQPPVHRRLAIAQLILPGPAKFTKTQSCE